MRLLHKIKLLWEKFKIWLISKLENEVTEIHHSNRDERLNRTLAGEYFMWLINYLDNRGFVLCRNPNLDPRPDHTFNFRAIEDDRTYLDNFSQNIYGNIFLIPKEFFNDDDKYELVSSKDLVMYFNQLNGIRDTHHLLLKETYMKDFFLPDELFENLNGFFEQRVNKYKPSNTTDTITSMMDKYNIRTRSMRFSMRFYTAESIPTFKNPFSPYTENKIKRDKFAYYGDVDKKQTTFGSTQLVGSISP